MKFVQARNYTKANRETIDLVVIHDMEYPEKPNAAEWCADFFAGPAAPKASAHYCLAPETRVLCADLVWRPIGDVAEGHRLVATEEHTPGTSGRTLQQATITKAKRREAECLRITFNDGREVVCSLDHRWLVKPPLGGAPWEWHAAEALAEGWRLLAPMRPWEARSDRDAGYLEGIYDGEGCWSSNGDLSFAQKRGAVLDRAHAILNAVGLPYRLASQRDNGVVVTDLSGLQATMQALGQFRPRRLMHEPRWVGRALKSRTHSNHVTIASVERVGVREVVSIETSTHTFFAEGIVSHNCVDDNSIVQCVLEKDVAWHAPGANARGIGIEHAGYAKQKREEWLDPYSAAMLEMSAGLVADICRRYSIPVVRPSVEELKKGARGIIGHIDATNAWSNGKGHYDPGPNFPWDWFLARVAERLEQPTKALEDPATDPSGLVSVDHDGARWLVSPTYIGPIGIGEAEELANRLGYELPTPGLVDAIWRAADRKIDASRMVRTDHDGTPATMASPEMMRTQAERIAREIGDASLGIEYRLLAGVFKDVVRDPTSGKIGLYGWHRANGTPIQPFYAGHARGWRDYSQGLRLVRRA